MGNQRFSITPAAAAIDKELPDSVFRTLSIIGIYGDQNGWCWPSQSTLADLRNVSRQTVNTHIKQLIKSGYLNIQPRYDDETGAQKSNMMQIKFDRDFTPPVKSMTLQGVSSPGLYTPYQAQDFTHNAPTNAPKNNDIYATDGAILPLVDALKSVAKQAYTLTRHVEFDDTALTLFGWEATPEQVIGFGEWWDKHCWYDPPSKASLKTIVDEWQNYRQSSNSRGRSLTADDFEIIKNADGELVARQIT